MCEYCKKCCEKDIGDTRNISVSLSDKELYINFQGKLECDWVYFKINYCPMCGEKLNEEVSGE